MKKLMMSAAVLAALTAPAAHAALSQPLPSGVITQLGAARSPAQVAALALANPSLAATIIADAARLGIATAANVVGAAETTDVAAVAALVRAASEGAPADSDAIARAGFLLLGSDPAVAPTIAEAAIQGLIDANVDAALLARESVEIATALFALVPEAEQLRIAAAIAAATPDTTDSAQSIAEAANGIETAGPLLPFGDRRARPLSRVPSFVQLPTAASPN